MLNASASPAQVRVKIQACLQLQPLLYCSANSNCVGVIRGRGRESLVMARPAILAWGLLLLCVAGTITMLLQQGVDRASITELEQPPPQLGLLQELASAPRRAATRSLLLKDLRRLARDIDAEDRRRRVLARRDTEGLGMRHESAHARAHALLQRHASAGALRRLDRETSKLLDKWFGRARDVYASQRRQRDELAFGARAFDRVEHEHERARERDRDRVHVPGAEGKERSRERANGNERSRETVQEVNQAVEAAERRAEARVQGFFTRKAEALQRLYRKEQLSLKYQAEYLGSESESATGGERRRRDSPRSRRESEQEEDADYRAREKRRMERSLARGSEERDRHGRTDSGVAQRRQVRMEEPASARHHWASSTERDIARVDDARAKPGWDYSGPTWGPIASQLTERAPSPMVTTALAPSPSSRGRTQLTWPIAPRRHPQGAFKDSTVYDDDYSWPSTSEVVEGDEWQRKGDCGMFGANC